MKKLSVKKLALAGMLCALCVVGSVFSFPMFGSKCAPIQHMVNVTCAVLLGPWWGVGVAFVASLLRNLLVLGSLMAFPGSMFGALLCGLVYHKTKNILATMVCEVFGTRMTFSRRSARVNFRGYGSGSSCGVAGADARSRRASTVSTNARTRMRNGPEASLSSVFNISGVFVPPERSRIRRTISSLR